MSDIDQVMHSERALELRQAFDRSFAEPIETTIRDTVDFISIRLAGDAHAIRMSEIAGLHADVAVVPCPSPFPELLGLAGFRGVLTPVYDLAVLLGYPPSSGRWIVRERGGALALAFDEFDDHFRVNATAIATRQSAAADGHIAEIAHQAERSWVVIDIPSIVAALRARAAAVPSRKEY